MVVEHFARDPFLGLSFPQDGVEVGEVVVNVDPDVAPTAQGPAAQFGTLDNTRTTDEMLRFKKLCKSPVQQVNKGLSSCYISACFFLALVSALLSLLCHNYHSQVQRVRE